MATTVQHQHKIDVNARQKVSLKFKDSIAAYLLILPNMTVFVLWVLFPVVFTFVLSFTEWNFLEGLDGARFIGLSNYQNLPGDPWFTDSMVNTIIYTAVVVPCTMALGLFFALLLDKQVYFPVIPRILIFIPYITSPVAIAAIWMTLFSPNWGPVNVFLFDNFGIEDPPKWFASSNWALPALIIVTIWKGMGYNALIYLAGLQSIPEDLYEVAAIDGAGWFKRFTSITLPLLSPTTFFLGITGVMTSFRVFELVAVITQGGPGTSTTVIAYSIYRAAFSFYRMGYASAMAVVMLIIVMIFTLIQWRIQQRQTQFLRD